MPHHCRHTACRGGARFSAPTARISALLWGSLAGCVPIGNRHARRLSIAAQDAILPHGIAPFLTVMLLACLASAFSRFPRRHGFAASAKSWLRLVTNSVPSAGTTVE